MHGTHQGGVDCQLAPPKEGNPSTTTSKRRLSVARTGRSKSRIVRLVPTRPPASRQMRAAALSSANPLLPKTPALAHAARWWPNESIGRPHLQVCKDRGNGKRRRRKRTIRKRWGGICVKKPVGTTDKAVPAPGPAWDRIIALFWAGKRSKRTWSRNCRSTLEAASCCHPCRTPPGSNSSGSRIAGRAPEARASHEGGSKPMVPVRDRMALAAAPSEGPSGTPSNSPTKWFAISRCLAWIIGSASAQLAQKAETLVLAALRKPNPPNDNGSEAESVVSSLWTGST